MVLSKRLQQEIEDQRRLGQAERGELVITVDTVPVQSILDTLKLVFEAHPVAKGKQIEIVPAAPEDRITTEISLLTRVLTNMTKNALEAVEEGQTVRVWYERNNGNVMFQVQNPGVMPEEVQLRMFNRSFSTKAEKGRGIGTYSMKLFGERYLKGKVGFESTPKKGTIFFIELPKNGPQQS